MEAKTHYFFLNILHKNKRYINYASKYGISWRAQIAHYATFTTSATYPYLWISELL